MDNFKSTHSILVSICSKKLELWDYIFEEQLYGFIYVHVEHMWPKTYFTYFCIHVYYHATFQKIQMQIFLSKKNECKIKYQAVLNK